eukprot:COSAG01_NODE_36587_length_515_cov_2.324519_1_plen_54_part_10
MYQVLVELFAKQYLMYHKFAKKFAKQYHMYHPTFLVTSVGIGTHNIASSINAQR